MRVRLAATAMGAVVALSLLHGQALAATLDRMVLSPAAFPADIEQLREDSHACVTCHVHTDLGRRVVYGGDVGAYVSDSGYAHSRERTPCLACHLPHGGKGMRGAIASKRLRVGRYQRELVADLAGGDVDSITDGTARVEGWKARDIQITAFCTTCHPVYSSSSEQVIVAEEIDESGDRVTSTYRSHPLATAKSGAERPDGPAPGKRIAAVSSTGCRSCHAAGETDGVMGESFPHSTPSSAHFLVSSGDASQATAGAARDVEDGLCLRCHRWREAQETRGVGIDW